MTTKTELLNQKNNIDQNLKRELNLNYKYYEVSKDTEFNAEDYYFKLCLFALYRAIEDEISIIIEERKNNSINKDFYDLLFYNKKTFWIDTKEFKVIIDDLKNYAIKITYKDIINIIETLKYAQKLENNEIIRSIKLENIVNFDYFNSKYIICRKNRNKLMHSIISNDINLTKNAIIDAFIVYSYLFLIINDLTN